MFCTQDQLMGEVKASLDFLNYIYTIFGFTYELELSTRPKKRLGTDEQWDVAEKALAEALDEFGKPWKEDPGDGAFYGPKIDIKVMDSMKPTSTISPRKTTRRSQRINFAPADSR